MKKILKKNSAEIITFLTTIIILSLIFKLIGIFDHTILKSDLETQTFPLFKQFLMILTRQVGLFSFNLSMGDSLLGTIYYYLMSPFNLLAPLIKNTNILFITIIIFKSAFSSLFCYKYLKYQFKLPKEMYLIVLSLFYGLSAYFISYNMFIQFFDVYMLFPLLLLGIDKIINEKKYLTYIVTLMLTIVSNYYFAYMVCIFVFLYYNYKILINRITIKEWTKKNTSFIFVSFLICLAMSFILLPIASEIGTYSRENTLLFGGESIKLLLNLRDFINNYIIGSFLSKGLIDMSAIYIYTSIIVIPLIYFYFVNQNIARREKKLTGVMLSILILSISINYINYMWHGFIPPCALNGRYTFMFILFMIYICCKSLSNITKVKTKHYIILYLFIYFLIFTYTLIYYPRIIDVYITINFIILYLFITLTTLFIKKYNAPKLYIIIFSLILITGLLLVLIISKISLRYFFSILLIPLAIYLLNFVIRNKNIKIKHFIYVLLFILSIFSIYLLYANRQILGHNTFIKLILLSLYLVILKSNSKNKNLDKILIFLLIFELSYNGYNYLFRYGYKNDFNNSYQEVIDYIKNKEQSTFYRIEDNSKDEIKNYSILYNYYGIDYFMSTIKKDLINFFINLNSYKIIDTKNTITYDGSYHLLSSLLNVKYYVEHNNLKNDIYTKLNTIDKYDIYKNEDSLEFGYMVDKNILNVKKGENGLEYINNIYKSITNNQNNILDKVSVTKHDDNCYSFINASSRDFYILIDIDREKYISALKSQNDLFSLPVNMYLNDKLIEEYNGTFKYRIDNNYKKNEKINITLPDQIGDYILDVFVYYYNDNTYKENIRKLKNNQLNITNVNKNGLSGEIEVEESNILFMSCLYNDELDVYVDEVKQEKIKLLDTFIGIKLNKGKHKIELKYTPKKFYVSLIPSFIGISLLIILSIKKICYNKKPNNR